MKRGCYPSHSGLCPNFYPDEVCRGNYSDHSYSPPLLYDLASDPSEIFTLDTDKYSDIMTQIEKVILCRIIYNETQLKGQSYAHSLLNNEFTDTGTIMLSLEQRL